MTEPRDWLPEHNSELVEWLTVQRWYGDKSRTLSAAGTEIIAVVDAGGGDVWLLTVGCEFADGGRSEYFVPLVATTAGTPQDGLASPEFRSWLARGFAEKRSLAASGRSGAWLTWEPMLNPAGSGWTSGSGAILSGEQSNTSINYGDAAILKVFRRLQPGINPDSEIVAFLTSRTGYQHVPAFLGSLRLQSDDGRPPIELAAVQAFIANEGDCWRWLTGALSTGDHESLLDPVALLGQRTGELHGALAGTPDLEAFKPEPYASEEVRAEGARLARELADTFAMIRRQGALDIAECERLEAGLRERVARVEVLDGLPRIRVHGDYHLGQVLRAGEDFVIIDFEGEPSRTMDERRQKHSPLKDVAGMLRSLDYAASSARRTPGATKGEELRSWGDAAERAFLDAYRRSIQGAPLALVPGGDTTFLLALDLFMIEKALYETRYELDNRPEWVDIPLAGLRRIGTRP